MQSPTRSHLNGAGRNAAESFNYYWPQELDDDYLVVWEGFHGGVHWRHLGPAELRAFQIWARYRRDIPRDIGEI